MSHCPACFSEENVIFVKEPEDYEYFVKRSVNAIILKCSNCKSLYQSPWPNETETTEFYPADYQNYSRKDIPLLGLLVRYLNDSTARKFSNQIGVDNKILDYGCGDGAFLMALARQGVKSLTGFETNERENSYLHEEGLHMINNLEELSHAGPFDVIRMNHVIEHLSELDKTMSLLSNILSPGGIILVQTPNPESITCSIFSRYWGALHYPYHTVLFTPKGIEVGASRWGLTVSSKKPANMPTGWSMSMENIIKILLHSKRRGRLPIYSLLVLVSIPLTIIEKILFGSKAAVIDYSMARE